MTTTRQQRLAAALGAAAEISGAPARSPWRTLDLRTKVFAGVVDQHTYLLFRAAHQAEPVTPMSWLLGVLTVLLDQVSQGSPLRLYAPGGECFVSNERAYRAWVRAHFPGRALP